MEQHIDKEEALFIRYKPLVRRIARGYYIPGADLEDLIQEGMLGLFKAIRDYDPTMGVSFDYFARLCTERQIQSAVRTSFGSRSRALNNAISYDEVFVSDDGEDYTLLDSLPDGKQKDPEETWMAKEEGNRLFQGLEKSLSKMENQVLTLYREGKEYREIAEILNISPKSCDNALQRIRRKAKKLWEEDF